MQRPEQQEEATPPKITFLSLPDEIIIMILDALEDIHLALSEHQRRRLRQTPANALSRINHRLHCTIGPRIFRRICAKNPWRMADLHLLLKHQPECARHIRSLTVVVFHVNDTSFTSTLLSSITELNIHEMDPVYHEYLLSTVPHSCNLKSLTMPWDPTFDDGTWWNPARATFPQLQYLRLYPMAHRSWSHTLSLMLHGVKDSLVHLSINSDPELAQSFTNSEAIALFESIYFPRLQVISIAEDILPLRPAFQFFSRHWTLIEINMTIYDSYIYWTSIEMLMLGTWTNESNPEVDDLEAALEDEEDVIPITQSFAFARRIPLNSPEGDGSKLELQNIVELSVSFVPQSLIDAHNIFLLGDIPLSFPSLEVLSISSQDVHDPFGLDLPNLFVSLYALKNIRHICIATAETIVDSPGMEWLYFPPFSLGVYDGSDEKSIERLVDARSDPFFAESCDLSFHAPRAWEDGHYQTVAKIVRDLAQKHPRLETFTWYPSIEGVCDGDRSPAWIWNISRRWNGLSHLSVDGRFVWQEKGEYLGEFRVAVGREHRVWSRA